MLVSRGSVAARAFLPETGVEFLSQPHPLRRTPAAVFLPVGTWLSLVEHSLGVRGVGSSNLPVPTIPQNTRISLHRRVLTWSNPVTDILSSPANVGPNRTCFRPLRVRERFHRAGL